MSNEERLTLELNLNLKIVWNYSHILDANETKLFLISTFMNDKTVYINLSSVSPKYKSKISEKLKYALHFLDYSAQYLRNNHPEVKGYFHTYYVGHYNYNRLNGMIIQL